MPTLINNYYTQKIEKPTTIRDRRYNNCLQN